MVFLLMLLFILIFTLGRGGEIRPYEVPPGADVLATVKGTWDWHMGKDVSATTRTRSRSRRTGTP
jgi:hypothetical protein